MQRFSTITTIVAQQQKENPRTRFLEEWVRKNRENEDNVRKTSADSFLLKYFFLIRNPPKVFFSSSPSFSYFSLFLSAAIRKWHPRKSDKEEEKKVASQDPKVRAEENRTVRTRKLIVRTEEGKKTYWNGGRDGLGKESLDRGWCRLFPTCADAFSIQLCSEGREGTRAHRDRARRRKVYFVLSISLQHTHTLDLTRYDGTRTLATSRIK